MAPRRLGFGMVLTLFAGSAAAQVGLPRLFQMAVDPVNNQSLWASSADTMYHSTDGGNVFRPVPIAPNAPAAPAITSFAINPRSGDTLFVIAQYKPSIGLLWRTTDGGFTWANVDPPGAPQTVAALNGATFFFNHLSPQTVYYQIASQLYKSTDNAATWTLQQAHLPGSGIDVNAADPTRMYCLLPGNTLNDSGLAVSKDEGLTWTAAGFPSLPPTTLILKSISGYSVLSDPIDPNRLIYAAYVNYVYPQSGGPAGDVYYFYSLDGGQTVFNSINDAGDPSNPYVTSARGEVVLNQGFFETVRSLDFGGTWTVIKQVVPGPYAFDPRNSNTVYGQDFEEVSSDGGVTWQARTPQLAPALPHIGSGGVVSLASGRPVLCPGDIFSIYGSNLAASTTSAPSFPLPQTLGGVQVTVNGKPVPLFYTSGFQVNAQLPWDTPLGSATIVVTVNHIASDPVTVNMSAAAPDILQYDGNRAIAVLEDGSINGATNPVAAGKYLVVYLTGVGPVDQKVTTGAVSPSEPLARATASKQLTLDGKAVPVAFFGLTPTFVGLGQLNLQVPATTSKGDHALILTVEGTASNSVLVSSK